MSAKSVSRKSLFVSIILLVVFALSLIWAVPRAFAASKTVHAGPHPVDADELRVGDIIAPGIHVETGWTYGAAQHDDLVVRVMKADEDGESDGYVCVYYDKGSWGADDYYEVFDRNAYTIHYNPTEWRIWLKKVNMITDYQDSRAVSMAYGEDHSTDDTALEFPAATPEKGGLVFYQIDSQKDSSGNDVNYFSVPGLIPMNPKLTVASGIPTGVYTLVVNATSGTTERDSNGVPYWAVTLPITITVTVNKADISPTISYASSWMYGSGPTFPIDVDNNPGQGLIDSSTFTSKEGTTAWDSAEVPKNAGEYTLTVKVRETDSYKSGTATKDVTIYRQSVTPTNDNVTFSPAPTPADIAPEVSIQDAQGNTIPDTEYAVVHNMTAHTVTIIDELTGSTYAENGNYDIAEATLSYDWVAVPTIDPAPTAAQLTYNGLDQALLATPGTATNGSMRYALGADDTSKPTEADAWKSSIDGLIGKEVGDYYVWYKALGDGENYVDSKPVCMTVTIAADDALKAVEDKIDALPNAEDVSVSDKGAIEKARAAYDALSDGQKASIAATGRLAKLTDDENMLEAALLAQAKQQAKAALDAKYNTLKDSGAYDDAGLAELKAAYDAATAAIEAATVIDSQAAPKDNGAWKAEQAGEDALDAVKTKAQKDLEAAKADAQAALDAKYNGMKDSGAYDDAGLAELQAAYDSAAAEIEAATVADSQADPKDNGAWKAEQAGEAALDAVKTKAQKDLEAAKADAQAALDAKYNGILNSSGAYDDAGLAELQAAYDAAAAEIEAATVADTQAEPKDNGAWKAEQAGEADLDAVKTRAQKDLETAKAAAKAALDAKYNTVKDSGAYDETGLAQLKAAYDSAVAAIEAATVGDTQAEPKDNGAWKAEQAGEAELDRLSQEAAKAAAKAALDNKYIGMKGSGAYDEAGKAELQAAYDSAVAAIEASTVVDAKDNPQAGGAWQAEKDGEAALNAVGRITSGLIPTGDEDNDALTAKQVTFNGRKWYVIADSSTDATAGTVTLLAADESFGKMKFSDTENRGNTYAKSKIKAYLDELTTTGEFNDVADAMVDTENGKLYLLSVDELNRVPKNVRIVKSGESWWTRTPQWSSYNDAVRSVRGWDGYIDTLSASVVTNNMLVRPGLQLDKAAVVFDSDTQTFTLRPHEHSFTYYSDGEATITATCVSYEGKCTLSERKATLTIAAPTLTTYGQVGEGVSAEAVITDTDTVQGDATVVYYKANDAKTGKTGDALADAPTAAGTYWAEITLGEGDGAATAHVVYTIAVGPATPAVTATYGQTLADVELPSGWTWADDSQGVGTVGERTFKANYTPVTPEDEANSNAKSNVDATVTVLKADPTAVAPTATATYGQTLADVALANPEGNTPGTWAWADGTQSVGDVGENAHKAIFTPTDTANYNTKDDADVTVVVAKADFASVTFAFDPALDPAEVFYTGSEIEPAVTGTITTDTGEGQTTFTLDSSDYTVTYGNNINVGTATVTVTSTDKNFTTGTKSLEFTIKKAQSNNVTVSLADWPYGQDANEPHITADFGADTATIEYKAKDAASSAYSQTVPTDPGEYTVRAYIEGTDNYPLGVATTDFKIIEAITLTLIGSAADGDDAFEPYEVQVPKGTSISDMDDATYEAIVDYFTTDSYRAYNDDVWTMPNPLSTYSNWEDVMDADLYDEQLNEDTQFYIALEKRIDTIELSIERPADGTVVEADDQAGTQTPSPVLTLLGEQAELRYPEGISDMALSWAELDDQGDPIRFFSGTMVGGQPYNVFTYLLPSIYEEEGANLFPKFGYYFDEELGFDVTVDNADDGSVKWNGEELTFTVSPTTVKWADFGYTIALEDSIDIWFNVKNLRDDPDTYTISFGEGEENESWTVLQPTQRDINGFVVASRAAKEMADAVHIIVRHNEVVIKDTSISIKGYCDAIISGNYDENLKNLCRAALDYGSYAQKTFNYQTDALVNNGRDYFTNLDISVPPYAIEKQINSGAISGATLYLVTTSKTQLVPQFKCSAESLEGYRATLDGVDVTNILSFESGRIKLIIDGIAAKDLGAKRTLELTDPEGAISTLTASPVDYMGLAISLDSEPEINRAFYNYYVMADAYFKAL